MKTNLIYLACPYSNKNKSIELQRFNIVNEVAAKLNDRGLYIFSPISHSHPIGLIEKVSNTYEHWLNIDTSILSQCKKLIVLKLKGWQKSHGVKYEIEYAKKHNIPIEYINKKNYV
jgi:hypothetical protein